MKKRHHPNKTKVGPSRVKLEMAFLTYGANIFLFFFFFEKSNSEIFARECLTKLPMGGDDVPRGGSASVTACDPK